MDNGPTYTQTVVTVTAFDGDPGDTVSVRLRLGRIYQNNQYYRLGTYLMTPIGGNQFSYTITAAAMQSYGWNSNVADSEITFDVTAWDASNTPSSTIYSHNSASTQAFYRSWSTCSIG